MPGSRFLRKRMAGPGIKPDGTVGSFTRVFTTSQAASKRSSVVRVIDGWSSSANIMAFDTKRAAR